MAEHHTAFCLFPKLFLSDFQDVNIFQAKYIYPLRNSGLDFWNSTEKKARLTLISSDFISTLEFLQSSNSPDYTVL